MTLWLVLIEIMGVSRTCRQRAKRVGVGRGRELAPRRS